MTGGAVVLQQIGPAVQNTLSQIVANIIAFFPRLIWSAIVLVAGVGVAFFVADRAEEAVEESRVLDDWLADPVEYGVKVVLMFFAAVIALSELSLDISVFLVFLDGLAFGLGVAIALAAGIAFGWGSKDYVADHLEDWIQDVVQDEDRGGHTGDGSTGSVESTSGGSTVGGESTVDGE